VQLTPHLDKYPNADLLWCQEEPLNNGAWTYVGPRLLTAANETEHHKGKSPKYAGRDPTSSVATGSKVRGRCHCARARMLTAVLSASESAQEGGRDALERGAHALGAKDVGSEYAYIVLMVDIYYLNAAPVSLVSPGRTCMSFSITALAQAPST
jgi:hypothetical protein